MSRRPNPPDSLSDVPPDSLPEPRGPRTTGAGEYSAVVFGMGVMVALGVGLAESSVVAGLLALAACAALAAVVYLVSSRAFRER